jgi:tetratricopeptide (TPR) repeat protein
MGALFCKFSGLACGARNWSPPRAAGLKGVLRAYICIAAVVVSTGCAEDQPHKSARHALQDYMAGDYSAATEKLAPLSQKTNEDFVLNNCRLGSVTLANYDFNESEAAFLRAYEVINSVGVNDGGRSLGAAIVDEKIKVWKGEPFERAMANFYLGVIYYTQHDYDNARAAFENALFKLRDYSDKEDKKNDYREQESNFVVATIMLAKTWQRLGRDDLAHQNFDRAMELRPDLKPLCDFDLNRDSNLLLVVDFGYGPKKVRDGDGAFVGFAPTPREVGAIPEARAFVDGQVASREEWSRPTIDLLAMAQDRKWQDIDTIRAIKDIAGTGMLIGGGVMGVKGLNEHGSRQRTDLAVAAGLAGAGLLLKASSQADVRQWEMLPRTVFILPLRVAPGTHDVTVDFPNVPGLRQEWHKLVVPDKGEAAYYMRIQKSRIGPYEWPPPAVADEKMN